MSTRLCFMYAPARNAVALRIIIIQLLTIFIFVPVCGQDPNAQKFAAQITTKGARRHLSILASDEYEGRETGKPGMRKAAAYLAEQFKKMGLEAPVNGSYLQVVPMAEKKTQVEMFDVKVNGVTLSYGNDYYFSDLSDKKTINVSELIFIGNSADTGNYRLPDDVDITNKVVMLMIGDDMKRLQYIQTKKPALIILVSPMLAIFLKNNPGILRRNKSFLIVKDETQSNSPVLNVPPAVANLFLKNAGANVEQLDSLLKNNSRPQVIKTDFSASFEIISEDVFAVNVLGFIPGTDLKEEVLVFSAHYDHIGMDTVGMDKINNGADDNGSGTTGLIEIARAFTKAKKAGKGPRRSILFIAFTGEEKQLKGSAWYADHPVRPLENTIADLNMDMIGRIGEEYKGKQDSVNYCYLIGADKLSTDLNRISENANAVYSKLKLDYNDPENYYHRSDHYNFVKKGVPVIFYTNGVHEDYHKPSDEVSKIDFSLLVKRAQLAFYTGWDLANRDKRPVVDVKNDMPE